jgi:diacylglycerol kinase (ATP)
VTTERDRVGVILNPNAGGGRGRRLLPLVMERLRVEAVMYHLHVTGERGEATATAARFVAEGMRLVVAVGGDGTVNEVANGLVEAGGAGQVTLGVVPTGRGSDFARTLNGQPEPAAALARVFRGNGRRVDLGRAVFGDGSSRVFVNAAGLGLDATVAARVARSHLPGSRVPYLAGVAGALLRYRFLEVDVHADGTRFTHPALAVVVANGRYFGGGLQIAPDAVLDDGRLDLAIIGDLSRVELIRQVRGVYRGSHVHHRKFTHLPARSVRVESQELAQVELDGEVVGNGPVTFTIEPNALSVIG